MKIYSWKGICPVCKGKGGYFSKGEWIVCPKCKNR
jgi:uncharacterized protein YbaR (Trm112 family)